MPAGPGPGDLGEVTTHGRDRPARQEDHCSTGISNALIGPCAAGTLAPRIGRRPADLGRSRSVRRGRAHHRPYRPDSLGHHPGRRTAHRSGRRHARCCSPQTARPAPPWPGRYPLSPGRTRNDRQRAGARPCTEQALIVRRIISPEPPGPRQATRARRRNPRSASATPAHQRHPVQTSPADPAAGSRAGPYSPHPGGASSATLPRPSEGTG